MPNKYEREIEEILRNMERSEPAGSRVTGRNPRVRERRAPTPRRRSASLRFNLVEWLLVIAVISALIAGGYAYAIQEASLFTGVLAVVGFICIVGVAISNFFSFKSAGPKPTRHGNTTITPISRNPIRNLGTRWHLFQLKLKYRRKKDH